MAMHGIKFEKVGQSEPCNIINAENFAITMSYLSVGFAMSFISTPLNIYMVKVLGAEPQIQTTIGILRHLPWSLKLVFGFLSDAVPMYGMHRKPYLAIGAVLHSFVFILYSLIASHDVNWLAVSAFLGTLGVILMDVMADTMCVERSRFEGEDQKGQMQSSFYSIRFGGSLLGALVGGSICNADTLGWGLNFHQICFLNGFVPLLLVMPWLFTLQEKFHRVRGDVTDTLLHVEVVELGGVSSTALNPKDSALIVLEVAEATPLLIGNTLLPQYYTTTTSLSGNSSFNGSGTDKQVTDERSSLVSDSIIRASNSNSSSQKSLMQATGAVAAEELRDVEKEFPTILSVRHQMQQIWLTVQLRAVWRPMAFIYVYNLMQVPNVAWQSYLQLTLHFPAWVLGLTVVLGSFMTFAGTLAYKYVFFRSAWRDIYIWTALLSAFFSLMQLLLIFQINVKYLHMSNCLFSMGDDVLSSYIAGIQFLPMCIMYMRMCPEGAEGASYAMLTTFGNIAMICSGNLGAAFTGLWDVSNESLRAGDVSGLWRLTLFTSVLSVLPLCLVFLLPKNAEEQNQLGAAQERSKFGGAVFLAVLCASLAWTIGSAVMRLSG